MVLFLRRRSRFTICLSSFRLVMIKKLHANKENRHAHGCLSPLIFSACIFKGSKPIKKFRDVDDDVVCGRRSGFDIIWKMEVNRFVWVRHFFFQKRYQVRNVISCV